MTTADLEAVARLHSVSFPRFFLTQLGTGALRELYLGFLSDGIALVAHRDGRPVGVAAGVLEPAGYYTRLLRRRFWRFAAALIFPVLRRPALAWRLLWRMRNAAATAPEQGEAALLSLAVAPAEQGHGIGALLVREFLSAARKAGAGKVSLTTDAVDNDRVTAFYERLGFRRRGSFSTRENRIMHDYVCDL